MRGGRFVPANAGEAFRYVTCPGMRGAHAHYRLRVAPGHHPGITRGRVNLALPARRGVPRPRPPGGSAIQTDNSVSVKSQLIAVPRPAGPRVQRAVLLRRLESAGEPLVLLVAPSGFGKTRAVSAAAGQGPLFPMLTELPIQEAGAHLLAGDLPTAAAALQHSTAPLSAPIVDEFRSPVTEAWVAFLHGDLVSAEAALDRAAGAATEHGAVAVREGQAHGLF